MNRRDFLKLGLVGLASVALPNKSYGDFIPEIDGKSWNPNDFEESSVDIVKPVNSPAIQKVHETKTSVSKKATNIVEYGNGIHEYEKSKSLVGEEEILIFKTFFKLNGTTEFLEKVIELQEENGLQSDGIIGRNTLFILYKNYFIPNKNRFSGVYRNHIERREADLMWIKDIKYEMNLYPNKVSNNGVIPEPWSLLKNIDKKMYGDGLSINKAGTFVDDSLYGLVPYNLNSKQNKIYIENFYGKKILRVYVNGVLEIATYVSPGKTSTKTPAGIYNTKGLVDKYHASSNEEYKGAVMPYAVHVVGGVWLHGSDSRIDGEGRSHGCIRVPLFYQKRLYELVNSGVNFSIDTRSIYSTKSQNFKDIGLNQDMF